MSLPPNLRRYLPFVLIAFFLLLVLPSLFKKGTSSTTGTPATQSAATIKALNLVDRSEQSYQTAHGHYTPHLADLLGSNHVLAQDLTNGLSIQLDVGSDGQSYYALVGSPVLSLLRARHDRKISAETCVIVKSGTGVSCPPSPG
jgi:competence protein ComGC